MYKLRLLKKCDLENKYGIEDEYGILNKLENVIINQNKYIKLIKEKNNMVDKNNKIDRGSKIDKNSKVDRNRNDINIWNIRKAILFIIFILIFLILDFLIPTFSKASTTAVIYLNSNKETIQKDEKFEISINVQNQKISAYNAIVHYDDTKLDFVSGPDNININENQIHIVWFDIEGGKSAKSGELDKCVFRAKEDGLVTISIEGEFYTQEGQLIEAEFKSKQIQIGKVESNLKKEIEEGNNEDSTNAFLKNLRIDKEGMVPNFESSIENYDLTITNDISEIGVLALPENSEAVVEVTGNTGLKEGINYIDINVISEDGTQKKNYKIQVTMTSNLEQANTSLENLAIENLTLNPPYHNSITHYNIEISKDISKLNILAVPENEKGKVEILGNENLKAGNNEITIIVTAQNGFTKREYKIKAYKRNEEEEILYQEEQKKAEENRKEELEKAYQIEKTSITETDIQTMVEDEKNVQNNYIIPVTIGVLLVLGIVFVVVYNKKKR